MPKAPVKFKRSNTAGTMKSFQIGDNLTITPTQHQKLLEHITVRLNYANNVRDPFVDIIKRIDQELSGWLKLSPEDKERERKNIKGEGPMPTATKLQLVDSRLEEIATYLLQVLFPEDGMYKLYTTANEQPLADGFSLLMNEHGDKFKHYRHYARGIAYALRYNFAAWIVDWDQILGTKVANDERDPTTPRVEKNAILYEGNYLESCDMYNFIWDTTVKDLTELYFKGEFFAICEQVSSYHLKRMKAQGEIFNIDDLIDKGMANAYELQYFKARPELRNTSSIQPESFDSLLGGHATREVGAYWELVHYYGWISPKEFGLSEDEELQVWVITMTQAHRIISARPYKAAFGYLPVATAVPWDDVSSLNTKSIAERLIPLQNFASHEINVRQEGARKALYGLLFFNRQLMGSLADKPHVDLIAGVHPVTPPANDPDLRKHLAYFNHQPNTNSTVDNITLSIDLMKQLQPQAEPQQVADLERATRYQAAAYMQGANKRPFKIAKLIDVQALSTCREMMLTNALVFQKQMKVVMEDGSVVEINPSKLRELNFQFKVAEGLKGIDKLHVTESVKEVLNMVIQSQEAIQQTDILKMIDYYTSLLGDKFDYNQFRIQTRMDKLPPQEREAAFELYQQALAAQQEGGSPNGAGAVPTQTPSRGAT